MAIEERTIIDQIEITRSGSIQIRFGLLLVKDGVEIGCRWHRIAVEPGGDIDAAIAAVNADITTRPGLAGPAVETDRLPEVKEIARLVHTPERVKAHRAAFEAATSAESPSADRSRSR